MSGSVLSDDKSEFNLPIVRLLQSAPLRRRQPDDSGPTETAMICSFPFKFKFRRTRTFLQSWLCLPGGRILVTARHGDCELYRGYHDTSTPRANIAADSEVKPATKTPVTS